MNTESIFITQNSEEVENLSGKLTRTCILDTIPKTATNEPIEDWEKTNNTEWRWRFLEYNNKMIVEISYRNKNKNRMYCNKYGKWVERDVPKDYDKFVVKEFYYYN